MKNTLSEMYEWGGNVPGDIKLLQRMQQGLEEMKGAQQVAAQQGQLVSQQEIKAQMDKLVEGVMRHASSDLQEPIKGVPVFQAIFDNGAFGRAQTTPKKGGPYGEKLADSLKRARFEVKFSGNESIAQEDSFCLGFLPRCPTTWSFPP